MFSFAVKKGIMRNNPCKSVTMLQTNDEKVIEILTPEEEKKLFPANWETIWDDKAYYLLNRLASITGMRFGELLGLRGECVYEDCIEVSQQFSAFGLQDTKTHKTKVIPLPVSMWEELEPFLLAHGDGYVFSLDDGKKPLRRKLVYEAFFAALAKIGIDETERKRRNLSMHSWRHFLSTELVMNDIPDARAQEVTGHATKESRKRYNHPDLLRMNDVIKVQEKILERPAPAGSGSSEAIAI
jgi:integrase